MSNKTWYELELKEQMSNIHGEVVRLIRARNNFRSGKSSQDYTESYIRKVRNLIELTCSDPKNRRRVQELVDEESEIDRWINEEVDDQYILRYWEQYTRAIS